MSTALLTLAGKLRAGSANFYPIITEGATATTPDLIEVQPFKVMNVKLKQDQEKLDLFADNASTGSKPADRVIVGNEWMLSMDIVGATKGQGGFDRNGTLIPAGAGALEVGIADWLDVLNQGFKVGVSQDPTTANTPASYQTQMLYTGDAGSADSDNVRVSKIVLLVNGVESSNPQDTVYLFSTALQGKLEVEFTVKGQRKVPVEFILYANDSYRYYSGASDTVGQAMFFASAPQFTATNPITPNALTNFSVLKYLRSIRDGYTIKTAVSGASGASEEVEVSPPRVAASKRQ